MRGTKKGKLDPQEIYRKQFGGDRIVLDFAIGRRGADLGAPDGLAMFGVAQQESGNRLAIRPVTQGNMGRDRIARHRGVKMPSFFGYMAWSCAILIPSFIIVTLLFFVL